MDTFTQQPEQDTRKLEKPSDLSGLKFFSMAVVARTPKNHPSAVIEVTPIESLSIQDTGPVAKKDTTYRQTHQEASGKYDSQKDVTKNNIIEAEWLPLSDSNRDTPPCVYQDESVILFKYGDVQKYYWATIKHQPELRRKEIVRWSASNETAPLVPYTRDTSYFFEMNAIEKWLHVATPVNGEGVAYRLLMDVGKSQLDVSDNQGNSIVIQSVSGKLTITARDDMDFNAGKSFNFNAPLFNVNSPDVKLNGETAVSKGLKIANGIAVAGGGGGKAAVIGGDLAVVGNFQARNILTNSVTEGGVGSVDVPKAAIQNQAAASTSAPFGPTASSASSAPSAIQAPVSPSVQMDKNVVYDNATTVNKAPTVLTGDKVLDAPKLATGIVPKSVSFNMPDISSLKETASKLASPGIQLGSLGMGGLSGLADQARSLQNTVGSTISGATGAASSIIQQGRATVMDPINAITRTVSLGTSSVINMIQSPTSGFVNQVNGFLQPINNLSRSLGGKGLGSMTQLNALTDSVYKTTGKIYNINNAVGLQVSRFTTPINSLTSQAGSAINTAGYAAVNVTDPLRVATDTISTTQSSAQSAKAQLEALATHSSGVFGSQKTLDELL
jgi:hypothetical protein